MSGWDDASVDDLLADPIVRELMAADGVNAGELRTLLYGVQRTLDRYAAQQGRPTSLAGFVKCYSAIANADAARPMPAANAGRPAARKSPMALADSARSSTAPLGGRRAGAACARS